MTCRQKSLVAAIFLLGLSSIASGQEVSKQQIQGLDEQVQEIKSDALAISAELNRLEEKLLYPSTTEVSVFVSLRSGETFRLDSLELQMDGKTVTHHLYGFKEQEALRRGGVQRLYTGNIRSGEHELQVLVMGKIGSSDFQKTGLVKITKDAAPKIVEVSLAGQNITFKDR
ncbi:MAG TPA: hypothetical protein VK654_10575 [Nitrospirota bacterium]|nr:hypothetical protein [Nitrospirota bacterium]